ncbi:MAG: TIGR01777 family oxidoreductase [Actinomycetota bacterium]|nr:TIGR01777 family oxidoreductase [Actinomycetota bacterium]
MDVAVTGSSGLIGSALRPALEAAGHRVLRLVRPGSRSSAGSDAVAWDPQAGTIDAGGLEGVGAVVNLAGEGIGDRRWNDAQKARIRDSRVKGTTLLAETLAGLSDPPGVLVSGSAIGIYGDRGDEILTEDSPPGSAFLAEVCQAWEAATAPAEAAGIRVVHLRTGIVLSAAGGVLKKMIAPFKLGLGGRMGSGRQWMSWIVIDDEVGAIVHVLGDGGPTGPVNVTAPHPVTNAELTKALGDVFHRPTLMPLPGAALKLALGAQMAEELLLGGQRVLPTRLEGSGYTFGAPELRQALTQLLAS